jgi:hypothetical protein
MHRLEVFRLACAGLLGLAFLVPSRAAADWPLEPLVNVPLCTATGNQQELASVPDGAGGAITVWTDLRSGTGDVYVQRISAAGAVMWATDGVAVCDTTSEQSSPRIVADGSGGAIVTWRDQRRNTYFDIYAQRISASGAVQWGSQGVALSTVAGHKYAPAVTTDSSGGAIVSWFVNPGGISYDIYAQRIAANGAVQWTTNGKPICTASGDQFTPGIVPDDAGGAVITWRDGRAGNDDVYAQRVSGAGTVLWAANGVALCGATGNQQNPVIAPDGAGGAIVAWIDFRSASTFDIYAQRVSNTGARLWTTDGVAVCTAAYNQVSAAIIPDGANGAIVAWQDQRTSGTYGAPDIYAQRVSAAGASLWIADGVAVCTTTGYQEYPALVTDGGSGAIIVWEDERTGTGVDICAQVVSSTGQVGWAPNGVELCTSPNDQSTATIVADGAGGAIVAWQDYRSATDDANVYAQRIWANGSTPVRLSFVEAEVDAGAVTLTWYADRSGNAAATVYRSTGGGEWSAIGEVTADGAGYLRYTDQLDGTAARVGYRLGIFDGGREDFSGETWVDLPARPGEPLLAFALEPVRPNPSRGNALVVQFTLPRAAPASLALLDVAGRRVATCDVGSLGAGRHSLDILQGARLAPGLYLVRLAQGATVRVTRVAVLD